MLYRLLVATLLLCMVASCGRETASSTEPADSSATYSVVITSLDPELMIPAIKAVRAETGLGLAAANDIVQSLPSTVKEGLTLADATALAERLEESGLKIETRESQR